MPPEKFCGEHTQLVKDVGGLQADVRNLGRSIDTLRTQTLSGFKDAAQKADERHRELKKALNGKVEALKFDDDERTGEIQIVKQQVNKLEKWRYGLYIGGAILLIAITPLIGKLWDLIFKAVFGG